MKCIIIKNKLSEKQIELVENIARDAGFNQQKTYNAQETEDIIGLCNSQCINTIILPNFTAIGSNLEEIALSLQKIFKSEIKIAFIINYTLRYLSQFCEINCATLTAISRNLKSNHALLIRQGHLKAKANGKKIGRIIKAPVETIKLLRQQGLSIRQISEQTGISVTSVWRHSKFMSESSQG